MHKQENDSPQTTRSGNFLEDNLCPARGSFSRTLEKGNFDVPRPSWGGRTEHAHHLRSAGRKGVGGRGSRTAHDPCTPRLQGLLPDTSRLTAGSQPSPHFRVQLPLLGSELWLLTLASASLCCSISPSIALPEILGQPFLNFY